MRKRYNGLPCCHLLNVTFCHQKTAEGLTRPWDAHDGPQHIKTKSLRTLPSQKSKKKVDTTYMSQPSTNLLRLRLKKKKKKKNSSNQKTLQSARRHPDKPLFMWLSATGACSNLSPNSAINPPVIVLLTWLTAAQVKFIPPVSWSY